MDIRPVSDLRNKYPEVEKALSTSKTIFLTKNGYGAAVLMSINEYDRLTGKDTANICYENHGPREGDAGSFKINTTPELRAKEKDAARLHVIEKYGNKKDK